MASASISDVASSIIGGPYSYVRVLHHSFLLKRLFFMVLWLYSGEAGHSHWSRYAKF